jgi:hypothetical protein
MKWTVIENNKQTKGLAYTSNNLTHGTALIKDESSMAVLSQARSMIFVE